MAAPTIDPLIKIKPSKNLYKTISHLLELESYKKGEDSNNCLPAGIASVLEHPEYAPESLTLSVEDVRWIYKRKQLLQTPGKDLSDNEKSDGIRSLYFHELLSESEMILPQPKYPPRDPVLEARCQKLRARQEEMEYQKMTSNVDGRVQGLLKHNETDSFSKQSKKKEKMWGSWDFFTTIYGKICHKVLHLHNPYFSEGIK